MRSIQKAAESYIKHNGDREFKNLYNILKPILNNYISKYVHDNSFIDCLTTDVIIKATNNIDKYNDKYKFSTWIYTIARNHTYTELKKYNTHTIDNISSLSSDVQSFDGYEYDFDFDYQYEEKHSVLYDNVMECMYELDEKYRSIIFDYYILNDTFKIISERYNLNINTAKYRKHKGLINLQLILNENNKSKHLMDLYDIQTNKK